MKYRSDAEILRSSLDAGYVGGGYYNPVEEFLAVARRLTSSRLGRLCATSDVELNSDRATTFVIAELFDELSGMVRSDELLFGAYDKGNAPTHQPPFGHYDREPQQ